MTSHSLRRSRYQGRARTQGVSAGKLEQWKMQLRPQGAVIERTHKGIRMRVPWPLGILDSWRDVTSWKRSLSRQGGPLRLAKNECGQRHPTTRQTWLQSQSEGGTIHEETVTYLERYPYHPVSQSKSQRPVIRPYTTVYGHQFDGVIRGVTGPMRNPLTLCDSIRRGLTWMVKSDPKGRQLTR